LKHSPKRVELVVQPSFFSARLLALLSSVTHAEPTGPRVLRAPFLFAAAMASVLATEPVLMRSGGAPFRFAKLSADLLNAASVLGAQSVINSIFGAPVIAALAESAVLETQSIQVRVGGAIFLLAQLDACLPSVSPAEPAFDLYPLSTQVRAASLVLPWGLGDEGGSDDGCFRRFQHLFLTVTITITITVAVAVAKPITITFTITIIITVTHFTLGTPRWWVVIHTQFSNSNNLFVFLRSLR
jgi:hypothetical protein